MGDNRRFTDNVPFREVEPGTPTKHQRTMMYPDYKLGQAAFVRGDPTDHERSIEWQVGWKDASEAK
jgi:hypothetical protein